LEGNPFAGGGDFGTWVGAILESVNDVR
jgi:hypothetical protein